MKKNLVLLLAVVILTGVILAVTVAAQKGSFTVLDPKGYIGLQERSLMGWAGLLMLIVAIPVFAMTFYIAWKYRASNTKAEYAPNWDNNHIAEAIWWAIPCLIILILGVITWRATHKLDPSQAIASDKKPITIQVVALQWKWLFLYPDQDIATVNYVRFPAGTPVNFEITSDAPMNAFWIPQLGSQVYAMAGMSMPLHLIADTPGTYNGVSSNLSGSGFAGMKFTAEATSDADFNSWVTSVHQANQPLTLSSYATLAHPSSDTPVSYYSAEQDDLYDQILQKYMHGHTSSL